MNIEVLRPSSRLSLPSPGIKITGICYFQEKVFVGCSNGDLCIYDVDLTAAAHSSNDGRDNGGNETRKAPLIRLWTSSLNDIRNYFTEGNPSNMHHEITFPNVNGDNSGINKITIVSANSLTNRIIMTISNSDSIRIFERVGGHLNFIQNIDEARYFHTYFCYESSDNKMMAVGLKKKLFIFQMIYKSRNVFSYKKVHEINFKDRIRCIDYISIPTDTSNPSQSTINDINDLKLIIGLSNDFLLINIMKNYTIEPLHIDDSIMYNFNHSTFNYFGLTNSGPTMWIKKASDSSYVLIKDTQSLILFYDYNRGQWNVKDSNIRLTSVPLFVFHISPTYLLTVYNKKIEVIEIASGDIVQKLNHLINSNSIPAFLGDDLAFLASSTELLQFTINSYQSQLDQYLKFLHSDKGGSKRDVKTDLSFTGLNKAIAFVNSINQENDFFYGARITKEKRKQLMLRDLHKYKAILLFENYSKYHESLVEICSTWLISYQDVLALFPEFLNPSYYHHQDKLGNDYETTSSNIVTNRANIIKKITLDDINSQKYNNVTTADSATEADDQHSKNTKSSTMGPRLMPSTIFGQSKSQNIRKFAKAVNNLIIYLTDQRRIHSNFFNDDNTFLWNEIEITPYDLYDSLNTENIDDDLQSIAVDIDTALFLCYFHCKPMLLGPLLRLPNNKCDSKVVNECLLSNIHNHNEEPNFIKELLDFYYGRSLHTEALEMLSTLRKDEIQGHFDDFDDFVQGPNLTIQYLQKLGNNDLDLILKYGYSLLTNENKHDQEGQKQQLIDEDELIERASLIFMNDTYECESYNNFKVLEFIQHTLRSEKLATKYVEWVIFESDLSEKKPSMVTKFNTKLCLLYLNHLKQLQGIETVDFELTDTYRKLYTFLKTTEIYEPWTVLKNIPTDEDKFLRFTIFIYKRLGEHDKAIDVLFNQLNDLDASIEYSSDIYYQPNGKETGTRLLHKLLEDLLMHYDENIDHIAKLLTTQSSKISMLYVLTSLPDSFPIVKLNTFLNEHLRDSRKQLTDTRLSSELYKVGSIKLRHELLTTQGENYIIDNSRTTCSICNKTLGHSVLSVGKNNNVVHYACYQKYVAKDKNGIYSNDI